MTTRRTRLPVVPSTVPKSAGLVNMLTTSKMHGGHSALLDLSQVAPMANDAVVAGLAASLADAPPPSAAVSDNAADATVGGAGGGEWPMAPGDPTSSVPVPPSRIPAAFHVHDTAGHLRFPSARPQGDGDIGLLAGALGAMLEEWRGRLDANKPSFPLGAARWGVLQMCIYDMWCTIEEARIWDIGLNEAERFAYFYSPPLAAMLGRLRTRVSQAFATTLSMSQRMQFELQRWHAQWIEQGDALKREEAMRQTLQQRLSQLQERANSLEEERTLYAARLGGGNAEKELERSFQKLQGERSQLSKELRQLHAKNTSLRTSNLSLKLSNEGLMEELARWRARLSDDPSVRAVHGGGAGSGSWMAMPPDKPRLPPPADALEGGAIEPVLTLFSSYNVRTQRTALDELQRMYEARAASSARGGRSVAAPASSAATPAARGGVEGDAGGGRGVETEGRFAALDQLASSLSESEADYLVRRISRRRGSGSDGVAAPAAA